jgi:hypothetical protein
LARTYRLYRHFSKKPVTQDQWLRWNLDDGPAAKRQAADGLEQDHFEIRMAVV